MSAALDDAPLVDDEDLVRAENRRQAMGDDQRGPAGQGLRECLLYGCLVLTVEMGRRLVQDDDLRRLEQQPGNGQTLLLAAGEAVTPIADHGVEAVGQ